MEFAEGKRFSGVEAIRNARRFLMNKALKTQYFDFKKYGRSYLFIWLMLYLKIII